MRKRKVFVLWDHPLFFESIRLILQDSSIECFGAFQKMDDVEAQIIKYHPDTILIEETEGNNLPVRMLNLLDTSQNHIRVFRLSLDDNEVEIFHREQKKVMQSEDLLKFIRSRTGEVS